MKIPEHLLQIGKSFEQMYKPVLDFQGWRIAMLRHCDAVDISTFHQVERHNETNEVFILTEGQADLIICENGVTADKPYVLHMKKNIAYNIAKAVWHQVVMSPEAHIVIVEKTDTSVENSNYQMLSVEVIDFCKKKFDIEKNTQRYSLSKKLNKSKKPPIKIKKNDQDVQLTLW